jgi:hypothetical protein
MYNVYIRGMGGVQGVNAGFRTDARQGQTGSYLDKDGVN